MIKKIALIFFLTMCWFGAFAQPQTSVKGNFTIDFKEACLEANGTHTVAFATLTSVCNLGQCIINKGNGEEFGSVGTSTTFSYSAPGNYWIKLNWETGADNVDSVFFELKERRAPSFEVYNCIGNDEVQLKIADTHFDTYRVNYAGETTKDLIANQTDIFVFSSSGSKTITVQGRDPGAKNNCPVNTQTIDTNEGPTSRPITELQVENERDAIRLNFQTGAQFDNDLHVLQMATNNQSTFSTISNVYNINQIDIPNISVENNFFCFRLGVTNPCANSTDYTTAMPICSSTLTATAENNNNKLQWKTSAVNIATFDLQKAPGSSITGIASTNTAYDDNQVVCGIEYSYTLISNYASARSISRTKRVTAISNTIPTKPYDIASVVEGTSVNLEWQQDAAFDSDTYAILRSVNGDVFRSIGTSTDPSFTDTQYLVPGSCYRVSYRDICNIQSDPSVDVCPIVLSGELQSGNNLQLQWPAYSGYENGISYYTIEKFDPSGNLIETINTGSSLTFFEPNTDYENQVFFYRVTAHPVGSLPPSKSNLLKVVKSPGIQHPTAFVHNAARDENKRFKVFAFYDTSFELKIFNRWGELIFHTYNKNEGWDGNYRGNKMPEGTYVFSVTLVDQDGRTHERSGTFVLLKK